jgi:hypothetical protein
VSPNEVYDLLHTPFFASKDAQSRENIRKEMPEGAIALWITKPNKSNITQAKWGTYTRSGLIAFLLLYLIIYEKINSNIWAWMVMVMVGYEFAYTALRKEKNEIENILATERYRKNVNEFLRKTYPEYKPPRKY